MRRMIVAVCMLAAVPLAGAAAQGGQPGRPPGQQGGQPGKAGQPGQGYQAGQTPGQRDMARMMEQIRETNRWMEQHGTDPGVRGMGEDMEKMGDGLTDCQDQVDQLKDDPGVQDDPNQRDALGRFEDRLHDMRDELEGASKDLRKLAGS